MFKCNNGRLELLDNTDILVDGKFEIANKEDGLKYKVSSNQIIMNVKESLKNNKIIIYM